jgi:ornithine carrier protein
MLATETLPVASAGVGALLAHPPPALRPAFRDLPGPFAIIASTIRSQGLKGLWLGQTGTLIRETGGGAAWFTTKEFVSSLFLARRAKGGGAGGTNDPSSKQLQPWESAASGACAGVAYNVVLFPADSVKSAIQTEQELRPRKPGMPPMPKTTFSGTFKAIYKAQGLKGLYAGMGITVARAAPSSAIIFVIYDTLDKHFG